MTTEPIIPTQEPTQEPAPLMEGTEGVGDIMTEGKRKGMVTIIYVGSILVYLSMIAYAEAHGINMLTKGVNPDFLIWAYAGMAALGLTAILLPLALHFWTHDPVHKIAALLFYVVDLALLGVNTFTDYSGNTGGQLTSWARLYVDYILPATPVIAGVGWSILWMLDPSNKAMSLRLALRAAIMQKKANQIVKAANNPNVSQMVNAAAESEVQRALTELFGAPVTAYRLPDGYQPNAEPGTLEKIARSFFDLLHIGKPPASMDKQSDNPD